MISNGNFSVLVIEDEAIISDNMASFLSDEGYRVMLANNGTRGLELFKRDKPDIVLLDLRMPDINGIEILKIITRESIDTPVIIVSGTDSIHDAINALQHGAWDFITKPIKSMTTLVDSINRSIKRVTTIKEKAMYQEALEGEIIKRTREIQKQSQEISLTNQLLRNEIIERKKVEDELQQTIETLQKAFVDIIKTIAFIVEIRDPYTGGHQRRVAQLSKAIADELRLQENQIHAVYTAAMLHDVGKISIPIEILCKPTIISELEMTLIKEHPVFSYEILKEIDFLCPIAHIVKQHHERLNGSGYPDGLTANKICIEAKIIAVADVVESMSTHRPYRAKVGIESALSEINANKSVMYAPDVVEACNRVFHKGFIFADE